MNYTAKLIDSISQVGSLPRLLIKHPHADAEIFLHGAHLTHWQPAGHDPVLFVSSKSMFAPGKPIRGGVPICFPWFAAHATDPSKPPHGFARLREWSLIETSQTSENVFVHLRFNTDDKTRSLWPSDVQADFKLTIGRTLEMKYVVTNTGNQPIQYEEALHTYYRVSDVRNISVGGLQGATYLDKPNGLKPVVEQPEAITFSGEVDRPYLNTTSTCVINDPVLRRKISIEKSGSKSTVVWNPHEKRAAAVADIGDGNWQPFVCVETANCFENAVKLTPGQSHEMATKISVEKN